MTTTTADRIAAAIRGILDEDRRESRERIAELERDLAGARHRVSRCMEETADANVTNSELDAVIIDLNRQLDEAHKENARLVQKVLRQPAPVVEEQGPWVVTMKSTMSDTGWHYYNSPSLSDWADVADDALTFARKSVADAVASQTNERFAPGWFVRTLAEARAIGAKRG
jgi:cell division septum initiation protein DivIVA